MTSADNTPVPQYLDGLRLDGRPFLLLGAGQGIGRQTAHALHQAGARLVCVDRDPTLAAEIAAEVDAVPVVADITQRVDVQRCVDATVEAYGSIAGIIDIVGVSHFTDLVDISDEVWDSTFDIVLRHVFLVMQIGGRALASAGGGVMTFVASISGLTSAPQHAAYGAAKAGLMSLVRTAAVELGDDRVRVNAIAPGGVLTPRMIPKLGEEGRRLTEAIVPLGRMAVPADIANGLLFLSSDMASFISGQVLTVDGGGHITFPYGSQKRLNER
jgi:NAD(P)-dependent dehydrogenase (short-subunit alcohol dehydrogenase family)